MRSGVIRPAFFRLTKRALDLAKQSSFHEEHLEIIEAAQRELKRVFTKGYRTPAGDIALATTVSAGPGLNIQNKESRLKLRLENERYYLSALQWLWSYYDSLIPTHFQRTHDSLFYIEKSLSNLSHLSRVGMTKAQRHLYERLKEIRKGIKGPEIERANAESAAGLLIEEKLLNPWKLELTEFISLMKNQSGEISESEQLKLIPIFFQLLISTPNRIRSNIDVVDGAPITAAQMYESIFKAVENWKPNLSSLIELKKQLIETLAQIEATSTTFQ
jgi:hypothetical protein